jgi:ATP phosphoribosyltransferase regulatory subunit
MDEDLHPALLPAGVRDILPPDAGIEAATVDRLMAVLGSHGYDRVKPPLVEYEASLLGGPGQAMAQDTFRMMDPVSHRMIGVRADMTLQIARIATARLVKAPRPLRLSYAGQVLRVRGSQLRPERQVGQVGAELIGSDAPAADAEVVVLASEALAAIGVGGLSVDLTLPPLVPVLLKALGVSESDALKLRPALDHKDSVAIESAGGAVGVLLAGLMDAAGPADRAIERLGALELPAEAQAEVAGLTEIVQRIRAEAPDLTLTIDPIENRGFEYHTGLSFTIFARGVRGELGRGGRYRAGVPSNEEASTGFTLYTDTVLRAVPPSAAPKRIYLPLGTDRSAGARLRAEGWITVAALGPGEAYETARHLGCTHLFDQGDVLEI